jgi:hypothetical protein
MKGQIAPGLIVLLALAVAGGGLLTILPAGGYFGLSQTWACYNGLATATVINSTDAELTETVTLKGWYAATDRGHAFYVVRPANGLAVSCSFGMTLPYGVTAIESSQIADFSGSPDAWPFPTYDRYTGCSNYIAKETGTCVLNIAWPASNPETDVSFQVTTRMKGAFTYSGGGSATGGTTLPPSGATTAPAPAPASGDNTYTVLALGVIALVAVGFTRR